MAADAHKVPPRVEVQLPLGETVPLVLEDGRWRVDGPLLEPWGQRTPRAALRTFVRALEQRRYDVLSRLVPARYRAGLTADKLRQYWEERGEDTRALDRQAARRHRRPHRRVRRRGPHAVWYRARGTLRS